MWESNHLEAGHHSNDNANVPQPNDISENWQWIFDFVLDFISPKSLSNSKNFAGQVTAEMSAK